MRILPPLKSMLGHKMKEQIFPERTAKRGEILYQSPYEFQQFVYRTSHQRHAVAPYTREQAFQFVAQALWEAQRGVSDDNRRNLHRIKQRLPDWFLTHWKAVNYIDEVLLGTGEALTYWCDAFGPGHDFFGALANLLQAYEEYHEVKFVEPSIQYQRFTFINEASKI